MTRSSPKITLATSIILGTAVGFLSAQTPAAKAPAEKPIEGTLTLGGKTYKLASVAAYEAKLFDDTVINVLACDKAIPMDKLKTALTKDGTDDSFMLWEPNVKVTFKKNGEPMSMNSWAGGASLSVSGGGISGELAVKDGIARGKFALASDDKGRCDFTFNVPMTSAPMKKDNAKKSLPAGGAAERPKDISKAEKAEEGQVKAAKPNPILSIYKLPLPKDAANVEYKTLVEQLKFTSPTSHTALAKSFSDQLAAAGWKKADDDLVSAKSAILHRKQGSAELTIMIKPADAGSSVIVFTDKVNWEKPAEAAGAGK
jgi:hypothetical protein